MINIKYKMKTIVFGSGPTGLALAWFLTKQGKKVTVIERNENAGGTWTTKWTKDGLFTHHSPQILSSAYINTFDMWKDMGIDSSKFLKKYDSGWNISNTTFKDKVILMLFFLSPGNSTVEIKLKPFISEAGWKDIEALCYLLDGVPPSIMTMDEFFGSLNQTAFYHTIEMTQSSGDGFAGEITKKLSEKGVVFKFNSELKSLYYTKSGRIQAVMETGPPIIIQPTDEMILTLDPQSLSRILRNSPLNISTNWGSNTLQIIEKGIYTSLSIQLHFGKNSMVELPKLTGNETEWGIISIPIHDSISEMKTLSCSIINMNAYSSVLEKHVRDCTSFEVENEVKRQIGIGEPMNVTFGNDSNWDSVNGWTFTASSAAKTSLGDLKSKGEIPNMFIVGSLNYRDFKPTTMESATESAMLFAGIKIKKRWMFLRTFFFLLFLIIINYCYQMNRK